MSASIAVTRTETARLIAAVEGSGGFHFAVLCQTVSVVRHSRPERPEPSVVEDFPSRQCTEATLRACAFSALPSAIRDVTRTTATKTVESPITTRRNQRERAQGSTTRISTLRR